MPSPAEFAERWGVSVQRICALRDAGMPLESYEAAEAWRAGQKGAVAQMQTRAVAAASAGAGPSGLPDAAGFDALLDMDDYISQLQFQRDIVRINRTQYLKALQEKSPSASKHYNSLNKAITQLFQIRDKALGHGLATKQLINAQTAIEGMRRAYALMVSKYEAAEVPMAKEANPGDANRALAVIRKTRLKIQREVFEAAQAAAASLTGKPDVLPSMADVEAELAKANEAIHGPRGDEGEVGIPEGLGDPATPSE